jgi:hypothetical protein
MAKTFTFHNDPGHGWIEVSWVDLKDLNLNPCDFSKYSHRRGNTFFLEEDCDGLKFAEAYKAKHGAHAQFGDLYHPGSAFIRNLPSIHS